MSIIFGCVADLLVGPAGPVSDIGSLRVEGSRAAGFGGRGIVAESAGEEFGIWSLRGV